MRFRPTLFALLPLFAAGSLLLASVPAHAKDGTASIRLSLPTSLFVPFGVRGSLTCDPDVDSDTREMMRALSGSGRYATYEKQDGDDVLRARRNGDQFRLQARDEDGQGFTLDLPWPVAQCLFAGRGEAMKVDLQQLKASGKFAFRLDGVEGVNLSFNFD
jgi:hypothetical protein